MFDLNREINNWSRSVHKAGWRRASRVAELEDHLHCAVAQLVATGLSEQEAFVAATEQLGSVDELSSEHSKNESRTAGIVRFLLFFPFRSTRIGNSRWATVVLGVGILLGGLTGAAFGSFCSSELVAVAFYAAGAVAGSTTAGAVSLAYSKGLARTERKVWTE